MLFIINMLLSYIFFSVSGDATQRDVIMPYDAHTKSSSDSPCKGDTTTTNNTSKNIKSASEAQQIFDRLSSAHTKSSSGENCKFQPSAAENVLSPKASSEEAKKIFDRLSTSYTKSLLEEECRVKVMTDMTASPQVDEGEVDEIVKRLHSTQTKSSKGEGCRVEGTVARDTISRKFTSEDEVQESFKRLQTTHTKSSSGDTVPCKEIKAPQTLPVIEGLDGRFKGDAKSNKSKMADITERLSSAHTRSSKARLDNPRILLYPERTLLCQNVKRINDFQVDGSTVRQKELARREKWFI